MNRFLAGCVCLSVGLGLCFAPGCGRKPSGDILVGVVAPKTGEAATFGISTENGIRLAVEEVNAAGGLGLLPGARKIRLIVEDDKGDPVAGKLAFSRLIEAKGVCAVIGSVTSKVSIAGADVAENSRTPMISPASTNPMVTLGKRYVFRACFIDPFQGRVTASFARTELKAKTAAVLYDSGNDYNKGLAEVFREVFTESGGEIVAFESYPERSNDFRPQLTKIAAAKPDVLFMPNYYNDIALQATQARSIGIEAVFMGGDGWDSPDLVKAAGDAVEGGCFSNHFCVESDRPQVRKFVEAYRAKHGVPPDALAALGYEAAQILFDAVRRAGADDPEKIRDALEQTNMETLSGPITFDDKHNPVNPAVILKIVEGKQAFQTWVRP